ncbi:MAG: DUF1735 domain-containing protein [Phocaeicola sp.]
MKKLVTILSLCGALMGVSSCDKYDDLIPEKYDKILSLKVYGEQELTLYNTGSETEYLITAMKTGSRPDLAASATVSVMSEAQFEAYLAETGLNYRKLPEACYSLSNNELQFSATDTWKIVPVSIDPVKVAEYVGVTEDTYVIPIIMASSQDSILHDQDKLFLKPLEVLTPSISFGNVVAGVISQEMKKGGGTLSIPLNMQIANLWDFEVQVEVVPSLTTIQDFTWSNDGLVAMVKGDNGTLELTIPELSYVKGTIGLRISSIVGMDFDFDDTPVTVSVAIEKYPLTTAMLSTNAQEPSEGPIANVIDGNIDSYFHSAWSMSVAGNHYIQVELPTEVSSFVFDYTNRKANGNAALYHFKVYAGDSENDLALVREYNGDVDTLPSGGAGVFSSEELTVPSPVKVIRFECVKNFTNGKFFVWSEFSLRTL